MRRPGLLYGIDANRNCLLDGDEVGTQNVDTTVDNSDGSMNRGWAAYLTLYSMEMNVDPDGEPKIDLNQDSMEDLFEEVEDKISTEAATFIVSYRQNGPYTGSAAGVKASGDLDL